MIPLGILASSAMGEFDGVYQQIIYSGTTTPQNFEVLLAPIIPAAANRLLIECYGNGGGGGIGGGGGGGYAASVMYLGSVTKLGFAISSPSLQAVTNVRSGGFNGTVVASVLGTSGGTAPDIANHVGNIIRLRGGIASGDAGAGAAGPEGPGGNSSGSTPGLGNGGLAGNGGSPFSGGSDFGGGKGANAGSEARAGFAAIVLTPFVQSVAP